MNKPTGYDEVQIDFTPIELGGHHLVIKAVREEKTSKGADMLVVAFDFAKNDKQPNYFAEQFEKDIRPDKKWPFAGTKWIMVNDYQNPALVSKDFKRFITAVEKSNGFEVNWGAKFVEQFKGKKVGAAYGIIEEEYNGEVHKKHLLRWFCEDSKADEVAIPEPKLYTGKTGGTSIDNGFVNVPDSASEEIPF